jgi:hypothetical protein
MVKGETKLKKDAIRRSLIGLVLLGSMLLNACGSGDEIATPAMQSEQIQTLAVATFSAGLTQTALAMPTDTPSATPTATNTLGPTNTLSASPTQGGDTLPTASCYRLAFVSDVTVPDNTTMTPGEIFTKTWRVRNSGSCNWEIGFKFKPTYGDAMGGAALTLDKTVPPGEETDLSIVMTAPSDAGSYQGNWRMTTTNGTFFGDEVYVLIIVGEGNTSTPTPTGTQLPASETPTSTATPTETTAP